MLKTLETVISLARKTSDAVLVHGGLVVKHLTMTHMSVTLLQSLSVTAGCTAPLVEPHVTLLGILWQRYRVRCHTQYCLLSRVFQPFEHNVYNQDSD